MPSALPLADPAPEDGLLPAGAAAGAADRAFGVDPQDSTIELPGVDIITTRDGEVVDVVGYFDVATFTAQVGLQTFVLPADAWPVALEAWLAARGLLKP